MGNDPTETKQEESVWQVQLGEAACMMTRRELDAALAREDIDPYTLVREPGTLRWLSLGTVRGIESETMNLKSQDVEIVPDDYTPSFVAPRPVPIETERERAPEVLTKEERAVVRPRGLFLPQLVLVGVAVFGGVFLAQHYLPSLSNATRFVRTHANASATQTSVAAVASFAPPASALPAPATTTPAVVATPVVAPPPPAPPPPERRVLLAAKPQATPARATASVRPTGPTAKKAAPATTRSAAKAKPAPAKTATKPPPKATPKPVASKPGPATTPARAKEPLKPDPARPSRPTR